jgi:hypothetical protein
MKDEVNREAYEIRVRFGPLSLSIVPDGSPGPNSLPPPLLEELSPF